MPVFNHLYIRENFFFKHKPVNTNDNLVANVLKTKGLKLKFLWQYNVAVQLANKIFRFGWFQLKSVGLLETKIFLGLM